jgi:hypothetical protein
MREMESEWMTRILGPNMGQISEIKMGRILLFLFFQTITGFHIHYRHLHGPINAFKYDKRCQRNTLYFKDERGQNGKWISLLKEPNTVKNGLLGALLCGAFFLESITNGGSNIAITKMGVPSPAGDPPPTPDDYPALTRAYNTLRYMYYDNTGGAVYSRTPNGMAENYKRILGMKSKNGIQDVEKVNMFLETLDDPFTVLIVPKGGGRGGEKEKTTTGK